MANRVRDNNEFVFHITKIFTIQLRASKSASVAALADFIEILESHAFIKALRENINKLIGDANKLDPRVEARGVIAPSTSPKIIY